ncbi:unnamed protein product [Paramecium octaurelia]|uniref:RNA helicase n=1 Tax=Paramecium octaurelia TaxID=43137 RepID=A0A8S1TE81_PAROT|nr:unnamed protein product [Paramecium octaurelia]
MDHQNNNTKQKDFAVLLNRNPQTRPQINSTPIKKVFIDPTQRIYEDIVVSEYLDEHSIVVESNEIQVPQPFIEWKDCQFPNQLNKRISLKAYQRPTPIQASVFPIIMSGHDLIGIAQTGSGKTIAYLLPGLVHIECQRKKGGPMMLILVPTRELAMQIQEHISYFSEAYNMNSACIYGGADKRPQEMALARDPDIVVATPGRLIDFLDAQVTNLHNVTYLVLDEADRMLDMGFEQQVRKIDSYIREDRQTVFFSATWPKTVQNLACDLCHNEPINLYIGSQEVTINKNITQETICLYQNEKQEELLYILEELSNKDKVLIFVETKKDCEDLANYLSEHGFFCMSLHGDKTQQQRDYVMKEFKASKCKLLCATDVASRGLDVRDISLVINYDFPNQIDNYVHRIGRTGRAGDKGRSITMITLDAMDPRIAKQLVDLLKDSEQVVNDDLYDFAYSKPYQKSKRPNQRKKPNDKPITQSKNVNSNNLNTQKPQQKQFNLKASSPVKQSTSSMPPPPELKKAFSDAPVFGFFNSKKE